MTYIKTSPVKTPNLRRIILNPETVWKSDRRVLLQLPQEERQILEELLNPETV